jgi:hypothetical protein
VSETLSCCEVADGIEMTADNDLPFKIQMTPVTMQRRKKNPIVATCFSDKPVCPKLYGMSMVKLGLLIILTVTGGVGSDSCQHQTVVVARGRKFAIKCVWCGEFGSQ